jgi:hypothetical protein
MALLAHRPGPPRGAHAPLALVSLVSMALLHRRAGRLAVKNRFLVPARAVRLTHVVTRMMVMELSTVLLNLRYESLNIWSENTLDDALCFLKALRDKCLSRSTVTRGHVARQAPQVARHRRAVRRQLRRAVRRPPACPARASTRP